MNSDDAIRSKYCSANRKTAFQLAEAKIPVFPALVFQNEGSDQWKKRPAIVGWQTTASIDPAEITAWWSEYPEAVAGIELGGADLVVLDADRHGGADGIAEMKEVLERQADLKSGPIVRTASGVLHLYF